MSKRLKILLSLLLSVIMLLAVLCTSSCESVSVKDKLYLDDYTVEIVSQKREFTLEELKNEGYMLPVTLKFTNDTGEDLYYAKKNGVTEVYFKLSKTSDMGYSTLITHKEGVRYSASSFSFPLNADAPKGWTFDFGEIKSTLASGEIQIDVPNCIAQGESFTVELTYDFSNMSYAKDGEKSSSISWDVSILNPDVEGGKTEYKDVAHNTDYSLSSDESYKNIEISEEYIFNMFNYSTEGENGVVEGYYSIVFGGVMYVNCIKIG